MALDRARIEAVLRVVLTAVPGTDVRLVGTASSVLRGIDIPASDIDIVFAEREDLHEWARLLGADHIVEVAPQWLPDASQYFARLDVDGVRVELSTVEIATEHDTMECFGPGPWRHFDVIACGGLTVPAVANELRWLTEWDRGREDRCRSITEFLRAFGADLQLLRRGLGDRGTAEADIDAAMAGLV